jgi:hypothetical protein
MGVKYFRDVVIGGMNRQDIWSAGKNGNIRFVDGDYGGSLSTQGNSGTSPRQAVTSITKAIDSISGRNAVIYVRPKGTAASAQTYYTDSITIPITKAGLSIIGAGANSIRPFLGVDVKATTAGIGLPLITNKAAGVHLEGMRLAGTGQSALIPIISAITSATSNGAVGLQIRNCRLDNAKTGGAIVMDSPNHTEIVGCSFDECATSIISYMSYGGVASRGLKIIDCDFGGRVATRNTDIYISQSGTGSGAGVAGYEIKDCRFLDGIPTLASGAPYSVDPRFIRVANGDVGLISGCMFACLDTATFGATGDTAVFPATWFIVGSFYAAAAATSDQGLIGLT